ncbi:hypothetical protein AALO_G00213590 [Alosa alosa]|uniref:Uncharacterized protein n=1 Tax=Alosa alosa TaxID=278164 RepID=A0AAV6G0A6_9TELE|nr:uncharacterized protein zgc:194621 [Alosa alosa]KAG5268529.1 hypothetical protein AALO_G00213590 [Alosa alosa]
MKMPNTKIIKPRTVEIKPKIVGSNVKSKTVESPQARRTKVNVTHKKRASSCTRCKVSSSQPKTESTRPPPTNTQVKTCATSSKHQNAPIAQKDERTTIKPEDRVIHEIRSHKAFTVIPPNPKKRIEIQKQAEAELAALEDLRLSRAMGYISLAPSSVGGRLTLEEVRNRQQQEMQIRRKQRQVQQYDLQTSPSVIQ